MNAADRFARLERLFHEASALGDGERDAFVRERVDPDLRAELVAMLRSDSRGGAFVDDPGNAHGGMRKKVPDPLRGERIGPYRLVERIAEGGMGVVYLAAREDGAFAQQVAIKLMRGGLVTERQLRRFESERRLLARLAHPNIARLFDGGTTERGAPYLAMEYIRGEPIDAYCDRAHLSVSQRVKLFISACDAVHCAHQNLVIHRDLKPSNVLVDEHGQPKLLDFGVAKLVADDDTGDRATETIARVFTPEYASPEQFSGAPLTTATDVYSLGVMLHVLLTGVKPFEVAGLSDPAFSRIVCEREATRPSALVESRTGTRPGEPKTERVALFAEHLGTTRDRLARHLRGDLDRIVLMALRKEPSRRYASVEQFASDLRRWLLGLPVIARPDTVGYRTAKFVRRNWLAVSLSSLILLSLTSGLVVATRLTRIAKDQTKLAEHQSEIATQQRTIAERQTAVAEEQKRIAEEQRKLAEEQRDTVLAERDHARIEATSGAETVHDLLAVFFGARKFSAAERDVARQNVLHRAEVARRRFADQDHLRANVIDALGRVCAQLGCVDDAEALVREAYDTRVRMFGENSLEVAMSLNVLGQLAFDRGRFDEARTTLEKALALQRSLPVDVHTDVAEVLNNLAATMNRLGHAAEAEAMHREALALRSERYGERSIEVAESWNNLAGVSWRKRDYDAAEDALRCAISIRTAVLGASAAETLQSEANLATLYAQRRKWPEAIAELERAAAGYRQLGAAGEDGLVHVLSNLGDALAFADRFAEAEPIAREAVQRSLATYGPEHRVTARARANLGDVMRRTDRAAEARVLYEVSLATTRGVAGLELAHANAQSAYGMCLLDLGELDAAIENLRAAIAVIDSPTEPSRGDGATARLALAEALAKSGDRAEARVELDRALAPLETQFGADHAVVVRAKELRKEIESAGP
ncbi:MAG: tetratricopeptide repeat protein [Planctomycetes bacterium]|nr:tetratricopeptide repeat protein [Planctomycetota bacterium]